MDTESAEAAQKKAKAIIPKVGYPLLPNTTDAYSLASYYSRVEIKVDDFFGNVLRSTVTDQARPWALLGGRRNRNSWEVSELRHDIVYHADVCAPDVPSE
jgi:endothelin-converting enzyme